MHTTSYSKMKSFFRAYGAEFPVGPGGKSRVLEIGSKSYEGQDSYRSLIDDSRQEYVGLDLEPGLNVDLVPATPFVWPEIADDSFQICISGQTFEHNPFFWVTASEMARVTAPGGYICLIAPGAGPVHRYPMDCWRFYPDSWSSLCALVGLELVETYWEPDSMVPVLNDWGQWRDTMLIARKPDLAGAELEEVVRRRAQLIAPFVNGFGAFTPISHRHGKAVADYLATVERAKPTWPFEPQRRKIAAKVHTRPVLPVYEPEDS
jgi:SAM-dependent methyltransferase